MTQTDIPEEEYLFWSQEHGEVYLFARDEDHALEKFYEMYSGIGDYEVVVERIERCHKCEWPCFGTKNIRDSWGADLYSCLVCDNCGEQFGGDLNDA
jgi:hypothetical protein